MRKNGIYQVFDKEFNKDNMYQNILNKLEKKEKQKRIKKYSFVSVSLIIILFCFFFTKNMFQKDVSKVADENKDEININEINQNIYDDISNADVYILDTYDSTISVEPLKLSIPTGLELDTIYIVYTKNEDTSQYDIVHDIIQSYIGEDKAVNVTYSTISKPIRDVNVVDGEASFIDGVEVMISKDNTTFIVELLYDDVYYDIESYNLELDEVLKIVKGIIE